MSPATRRTRVTDMTGRIDLRRRRSRRRRLRWAAAAALVVLLAFGLVWLVELGPVLACQHVRVRGNSVVSTDEVERVAAVPLGAPLARLDVDAVGRRVAGIPQVATVKVTRSWPSTAQIDVTERVAVYALRQPSGAVLVDASGTAYQRVDMVPEQMTVATLPDGASQRLRHDVATAVGASTPALREGAFSAQTPDSIQIGLPDGRTVVLGSVDDIALKVDVATKLLAAVKAKVYDVSAPGRPVTR